jgi:hypothetical protein
VDGFDVNQIMSGGSRIGQASTESLTSLPSPNTQAAVSLTAPSNGFVLVQGTIVAYDGFSICGDCVVAARLHDAGANVDSPVSFAEFGKTTTISALTLPLQWVFPATSGSHTYTLTTAQVAPGGGGLASVFNPVLTAEFIPFGHNGGSTLAVSGANTVATPTPCASVCVSRSTP